MKKLVILSSVLLLLSQAHTLAAASLLPLPADQNATVSAKALLNQLHAIRASGQFAFGMHNFNTHSRTASLKDPTQSDVKDVVGQAPGVLEKDFMDIIDDIPSTRNYHINAIKQAYRDGLVISMAWHLRAPDNSFYETPTNQYFARKILDGSTKERDWFFGEIDEAAKLLNTHIVDDNGQPIPLLLRLFHEANGGWFWWGYRNDKLDHGINNSDLKKLHTMVIERLREKGVHHVLHTYSPGYPFTDNAYPGDEYIDLIGLDYYNPTVAGLTTHLKAATQFAKSRGKLVALTETGWKYDAAVPEDWRSGHFWNERVLPATQADPANSEIVYVLTWVHWLAKNRDTWVPHAYSSDDAKAAFKKFVTDSKTLLMDTLPQRAYRLPGKIQASSLIRSSGCTDAAGIIITLDARPACQQFGTFIEAKAGEYQATFRIAAKTSGELQLALNGMPLASIAYPANKQDAPWIEVSTKLALPASLSELVFHSSSDMHIEQIQVTPRQ